MSVSIGIVGAGDIVRKMHLPVLQCLAGVKIAWLYDTNTARTRALADAYGVPVATAESPDQLPGCDVVLLAVPVPVREAYLQSFAKSGRAVFCEKPFALSAAEHRRYLEWFEPHRLGCGYMRRFYRSSRIAEHLVRQGWLGPLSQIRIGEGGRSRGSGNVQSFLDRPGYSAASGVLMDLGSHTLDLALLFSGGGGSNVIRSELVLDGDVDRHAHAQATLGPGKVRLDYEVSWLRDQPNRLELQFRDNCVWMSLAPDARVFMGDPAQPRRAVEVLAPADEASLGAVTPNQAFALEWREFLAGLAGVESRVSASSALGTTILAEQIRVSGARHA